MEEKIFDGAFFRGLSRIRPINNITLQSGRSGIRKSSAKGSSVEFSDFREYIPGDDIRRIDWNTYGRTEKLFVKLFRDEREAYYSVLIDSSKSMDFGEGKKAVCALRMAGAFAYMALNNLDRVRLAMLKKDKNILSNGMSGMQAFNKAVRWLENVTFDGETKLLKAVKRVQFTQKGITVIISDFFTYGISEKNMAELDELVRYLRYQKQEVILVHVMLPEEREPVLEGTLALTDCETKDKINVTVTGRLCQEYKKVFERFCNSIEETAKRYQAQYIKVSTDETLEKFIYRGLKMGQLQNF
ncbi:MAG: DUF58 domain-containing protein [Lachnospiraceae bacterium]|nr:DUF58 domain-containing protein [Lachnospiraceae bacterium]